MKTCPEAEGGPGRFSCGRPLDPRPLHRHLCSGLRAALIRSKRFHSDLFFRRDGCLPQTADLREELPHRPDPVDSPWRPSARELQDCVPPN